MIKHLDDKDVMILRGAYQRMTVREMADAVMLAASATHARIQELQKLGLLTKPNGKARSITLTEEGERAIGIK